MFIQNIIFVLLNERTAGSEWASNLKNAKRATSTISRTKWSKLWILFYAYRVEIPCDIIPVESGEPIAAWSAGICVNEWIIATTFSLCQAVVVV